MNHVRHIFVVAMLALLAACGGSGGGGASSTVTTMSGVASKGIFIEGKGTVSVYPVNAAGIKGSTPLAVGPIGKNGTYSVNIGDYSGPIVVEAYGTYDDEATGNPLTIPASAPLRAALDYVTPGKSFKMPVTPLTDLAYRQAGPLTRANISAANDQVSYLMRIDIINTIPVPATESAFSSSDNTQSQKDYSLILAAVSQIMATQGKTLEKTLEDLNNGMSSTVTANVLNDALATYVAGHEKLTGGIVPPTVQNLCTTSSKAITLKLTGEDSVIKTIQAFSVTVKLPEGLFLRTNDKDGTGTVLTSLVKLAGSAADAKNIQYWAYYDAAASTVKIAVLAPEGGLKVGDVVTITCDTPVGTNVNVTDITMLPDFQFIDGNGVFFPESARPSFILNLK